MSPSAPPGYRISPTLEPTLLPVASPSYDENERLTVPQVGQVFVILRPRFSASLLVLTVQLSLAQVESLISGHLQPPYVFVRAEKAGLRWEWKL